MSATTLTTVIPPLLDARDIPAASIPPSPSYFSHLYRLTVQQYNRMVEAGILGKRDRVELIEGILVAKMGRNRPHLVSGNNSLRTLAAAVPPGWYVAKEDPLVTSEFGKPEPDLAIVRGLPSDYLERDVTPPDVAMVAEIADSTLLADQREMKAVYAASRIPIYWIINLVNHRLEVYSNPEGREYRTTEILAPDQEVALLIDGTEIARIRVADLLP